MALAVSSCNARIGRGRGMRAVRGEAPVCLCAYRDSSQMNCQIKGAGNASRLPDRQVVGSLAVATQAGRQAGGMATRDNEFRICHRLCVNRRGRRKKETATAAAAAAEKMLRFLFYSFFFSASFWRQHNLFYSGIVTLQRRRRAYATRP